jgi:hypothetical protein
VLRNRLEQDQGERAIQIFERIATLFQRLPMLSGFCVESDLSVAEVTLDTWPGWSPSEAVREEIDRALGNLIEERSDNAELLRGRTFARSFH